MVKNTNELYKVILLIFRIIKIKAKRVIKITNKKCKETRKSSIIKQNLIIIRYLRLKLRR
jgi:hypothetical protein